MREREIEEQDGPEEEQQVQHDVELGDVLQGVRVDDLQVVQFRPRRVGFELLGHSAV